MTNATSAHDTYKAARDFLLAHREDYDAARDGFEWPRLEGRFNWATDWFDVMARGNDKPALWIVEEDGSEDKYSFDDMAKRSDKLAAWLVEQGIGKGDPVLIMLNNQVELWDSMLAIMKIGAVIAPTTTALGASDLKERIARAGAKGIIANADEAGKMYWAREDPDVDVHLFSVGDAGEGWADIRTAQERDDAPAWEAQTDVDDPLLLYFTSGTTSKPKLVKHTQTSYPVGHLVTMYWIGQQPGDVHLTIASPGWAKHAWSCFFAPWIAEACIFEYNYTRFDAAALLAQMDRAGVTTFCAPPTVWRMLIQADLAGKKGSLREIIGAGEPLNPEVIEQVQKHWGLTIRDGYGQTETTVQVGNTPGQPVIPGSMGRPLPGVPSVLVDPVTGERTETEGELCLDLSQHPVNLMAGYQDDPERAAESMSGGYYHTGDIAVRDERGAITFVGRTDDVFKASDYKISPFELESVLIEHPAVAEAAVVPAPDEVRLAVPKAYVVLASGWDADEKTAFDILKHCREGLAPFQRIRRLEFGELPKTISGKIRRVELRQREDRLADGDGRPEGEYRDSDFPELKGSGS
ncbi:AMP-binding protein [Mobilicoccus massiliensis]|uniref:AMP-binding protein n=1 Tax=Mobilicoccus massiliensis TaxID=1522310 RepID=UPI00058DBB43|nr:AMP-binding protein [Mobilicoccus massiliensis]